MTETVIRFQTERGGLDCRVIVRETNTTTPEERRSAMKMARDVNALLTMAGGKPCES